MITLKGYGDVKLTDRIEMPDILTLIEFPFVGQVDFEDLYRHASSDLRYLMDKVPLINDGRYVTVNMTTQLLSPRVTAAPRGNWHFDTSSFKSENATHIHLLLSDCTAVTEFTRDDIILEQFDEECSPADVEVYLNQNQHLFEGVPAECGKFITFDGARHFHRAVRAERLEFRFMMRVMESNDVSGTSLEQAITTRSAVFDDMIVDYSTIDRSYIMENKTNEYISIEKSLDGKMIILNKR